MVQTVLHIFLQIILEMLPVSSSGNLTLFFYFVTSKETLEQQFVLNSSFNFLLHGSTVLVIACYFFKTWFKYFMSLLRFERESLYLMTFCGIADSLTAAFYFLFKVTGVVFFPLWLGFFITGVMLFSLRYLSLFSRSLRSASDNTRCCDEINKNLMTNKLETILFFKTNTHENVILSGATWSVKIQVFIKKIIVPAFILGVTQGLALLPGISRFGSTFVVGRWLGFSSMQAFELSFLIAWPLMVAGTLKGFWQMYCAGQLSELLRAPLLFSILIATVLSWFVLQWVARLVKRNQLWKFFWWVWILAIVAFLIP